MLDADYNESFLLSTWAIRACRNCTPVGDYPRNRHFCTDWYIGCIFDELIWPGCSSKCPASCAKLPARCNNAKEMSALSSRKRSSLGLLSLLSFRTVSVPGQSPTAKTGLRVRYFIGSRGHGFANGNLHDSGYITSSARRYDRKNRSIRKCHPGLSTITR